MVRVVGVAGVAFAPSGLADTSDDWFCRLRRGLSVAWEVAVAGAACTSGVEAFVAL